MYSSIGKLYSLFFTKIAFSNSLQFLPVRYKISTADNLFHQICVFKSISNKAFNIIFSAYSSLGKLYSLNFLQNPQ